MEWLDVILTGLVCGAIAILVGVLFRKYRRWRATRLVDLIQAHFRPIPLASLTISEREFPHRVRADLQRAIDRLFKDDTAICHFCGVKTDYAHEEVSFSSMLNEFSVRTSVPAQYEEIDIGEEQPVRCLKMGLWLLQKDHVKFAVLFTPAMQCGMPSGMRFEVVTVNHADGMGITQQFFKQLEEAVLRADSYRGKILSLERKHSYYGTSSGITVHKLRTVERNQVILPRKTLELLDRNVLSFVRQRPRLRELKQATKKGLLFYGNPGTGKTHTIHYIAKALEGHTTLLIAAEQVGLLEEYMVLARLLQPTIVVIEDVDLIARDRTQMGSAYEEVLLNKLLNEMDGLKENAEILFILTTNRPEALEVALASRPGRIDQAIEFPLPDEEGREKLIRLYSQGITLALDIVEKIVKRTEKVSAAFIKELMRRSTQFSLERADACGIEAADVENALEEMLFAGGTLNLKLLGGNVETGQAKLDGFHRQAN